MGYKPPVKRYRLQFEDAAYAGLEIVMGSVSSGEFLDLTEAMASSEREQAELALKLAASKIIRWNIEDADGAAMPATFESLRSLDFEFVMVVIGKWMEAVTAVPPPLPGTSNGTGTIPPGLIPMETLSPSPAS